MVKNDPDYLELTSCDRNNKKKKTIIWNINR